MSRKQKQTTRHELPEESTVLEETVGSSEASSNQAQDTQGPAHVIDSQTKAYLDMMFQATMVSVIQTVKQYMDQQFEAQREWNVQCMETINRRFAQLEHANLSGNEGSNNNTNNNEQMPNVQQPQQLQHQDQVVEQTPNVGRNLGQIEAIDYTAFKQLPVIQGLSNPKAIETERIRAWWVMNWAEGQRLIEMLPCKPSLTNRVWKALVLGSFINLQEFVYKNMVDNVKYMDEDTVLQTAENGVISVKKRPRNNIF
ncbi:hypothetical protein C2G38_2323284 [Gigaspora rosea]|uniref:Uncharacterized protein n=1 Tax=Gigaspora rosea TaxID=44941 RepID=A0A397UXZ6_9GLOM|nr:hypothetical protein C2G38_2323284 [Gigaspora rosea]